MTEKELFIREVRPGIWLMDEGHEATGYLVIGSEKACVIDTMNGYNDLYRAVRKITDKPVTVVNTHGHPDHIFGNMYFEEAYIHPADAELARSFTEHQGFVDFCREIPRKSCSVGLWTKRTGLSCPRVLKRYPKKL